MIEDEIAAIVTEHYQPGQRRPLMLSNIGARLSKLNHWPLPAGDKRTLLEIVEAMPQVSVVVDQASKSFIAVVPAGQEQLAHDAIAARRHLYFLRGLPRALLLAFTLDLADGQQMYVQLGPRVTYVAGPDAGGPDAILVDADLRFPGLEITQLDAQAVEGAPELEDKIRQWCARHNLDPETLARKIRPASPAKPPAAKTASALERLYAAQDADVAKRLAIPLDIALTLSRLP
jgi:hypothetical protein